MIVRHRDERNSNRLRAALAVAALHALLGYLFVTGLGARVVTKASEGLKVFDVLPKPPPPVEQPKPASTQRPRQEGAAAPPNLKSKPSPVIAPPPKVQLKVPPTVVTAPVSSALTGSDPSAGAAAQSGPGTGSGGSGAGSGSGGQGMGSGGGGGGSPAVRLGGAISGRTDYPTAARRAGIEGSVAVRFTVGIDGSVGGCEVLRSSANREIDETTCRLIEERFRYAPARDSQGRPVAETVRRTFDWTLPYRR